MITYRISYQKMVHICGHLKGKRDFIDHCTDADLVAAYLKETFQMEKCNDNQTWISDGWYYFNVPDDIWITMFLLMWP